MPTAVATVYSESSQFKRWTLSEEELKRRRKNVNESTITTIKDNIVQEEKLSGKPAAKSPDFPDYEEELSIVNYYAAKMFDTGSVFNLPSHLKATAAAYLKRFFLAKSALQYHPKKIMITCLFLATKTCEHHIDLDEFVSKLPKQTRDAVLEHEFLISSAIEFDFVHWSAHRPLYGFVLDMESMIEHLEEADKIKKEKLMQTAKAHDIAKGYVNGCIWSDLPLIYSPSHLALAALYKSNEALVQEYLVHKKMDAMMPTLKAIGDKIAEIAATKFDTPEIMAQVKAADKKLYYSSDPALKIDSALYKKRKEEEEEHEMAKRRKKSEAARESHESFGAVLA